MHIWDDFIKKEELEIAPGIINEDVIRELNLNTYCAHIKDMIDMRMNQFPEEVSEHIADVMADNYICYIHAVEGRYPEPDEIEAHLQIPENIEARQNLTYLCVHADAENWPEIEKELQEMIGTSSMDKINWDSNERKENAEKWRKRLENGGIWEI